MTSLFDDLTPARHGVAVPATIQAFLSGLQSSNHTVDGNGVHSGSTQGAVDTKLLGFFTVALAPFGPKIKYRWKSLPGGRFQLDLLLSKLDAVQNAVALVDPNTILHAATVQTEPDSDGGPPREWLTKTGATLDFHDDLSLRIHETPTAAATITWLKFNLGQDPEDDVFVLESTPTQILFGYSGFGDDIPEGIIVDDSATASAPGSPSPEWTDLAIPKAKLYVRRDIPLIGGRAIAFDLRLGTPGGLQASAAATIAAAGNRPEIDVRLEWQDPAAACLADLPTAVEAIAKFPIAGRTESTGGKSFTLADGDPLTCRVPCRRCSSCGWYPSPRHRWKHRSTPAGSRLSPCRATSRHRPQRCSSATTATPPPCRSKHTASNTHVIDRLGSQAAPPEYRLRLATAAASSYLYGTKIDKGQLATADGEPDTYRAAVPAEKPATLPAFVPLALTAQLRNPAEVSTQPGATPLPSLITTTAGLTDTQPSEWSAPSTPASIVITTPTPDQQATVEDNGGAVDLTFAMLPTQHALQVAPWRLHLWRKTSGGELQWIAPDDIDLTVRPSTPGGVDGWEFTSTELHIRDANVEALSYTAILINPPGKAGPLTEFSAEDGA
jgi:hypothetical protein